jgi:hypothetical protein
LIIIPHLGHVHPGAGKNENTSISFYNFYVSAQGYIYILLEPFLPNYEMSVLNISAMSTRYGENEIHFEP